MPRYFLILFLLASFFSCSDPSDRLIGKWIATAVMQDKKALDIDLNLVKFEFEEDGTYRFASTLGYREAGSFQVIDDKLITKDSIQSQQKKSVLIERLDSDTLKLKMKNPEGWMQVTLSKQ